MWQKRMHILKRQHTFLDFCEFKCAYQKQLYSTSGKWLIFIEHKIVFLIFMCPFTVWGIWTCMWQFPWDNYALKNCFKKSLRLHIDILTTIYWHLTYHYGKNLFHLRFDICMELPLTTFLMKPQPDQSLLFSKITESALKPTTWPGERETDESCHIFCFFQIIWEPQKCSLTSPTSHRDSCWWFLCMV